MTFGANKDVVPEFYILEEHIKVLKEAVENSCMYDIRTSSVYDALDYIERTRPDLRAKVSDFKQALENWSPAQLHLSWGRLRTSI